MNSNATAKTRTKRSALTSVIIPSYNHGRWIHDAIESALDQTSPCEVIVVDDGSTDDTATVVDPYISAGFVTYIRIEHSGPCAARNRGIDAATGEFLMFLDADDVMVETKVEKQLAAFTDDVGWVLSDVSIVDEAKGRTENASAKYDYAGKELGGWIQPLLKLSNFIPIMSPLVRRSVLGDTIRFRNDLVPEDWHFWTELAGAARVRYVPEVLATYRHRREGRSRIPKQARTVTPHFDAPLRLNLGCGTPATRSWHPMPGLVNLDKSLGWRFEDGLGDFIDGSVAGITISHSAMYVPLHEWPKMFSEFARVLAPGGIVRITEDDATNPESARYGGWKGSEPAVTLTDAAMVRAAMEREGLKVYDVDKNTSHFSDTSLCQSQHGDPPDVFFIEGQRMKCVVFAPHSDDEALFCSWTILRYRPAVIICHGSAGDYGDTATRLAESRDACAILGATGVDQWDGVDLVAQMRSYDELHQPARVWAPDERASHPDHVAVAQAAREVFGDRLTTYHTYIGTEKVRDGQPVPFEPIWVQQKLRALARYTTQLTHPRAVQFFANDLFEYYGTEGRP